MTPSFTEFCLVVLVLIGLCGKHNELGFYLVSYQYYINPSCNSIGADEPAKNQLLQWEKDHPGNAPIATDYQGKPVPSLTSSVTINRHGNVLLKDKNLLDHLAHLYGERIPERVTHAVGAGAHGYFEVNRDITAYTKASIFSTVGKRTKVFCRFSTALRERGSADIIPDSRGMACKFYTDEGNWDIPAITARVFLIRDPILFASNLRAHKRNPQTNLFDPNMVFDFRGQRPESIHHTLQILSDIGTPDGFRHIDAHAVHAFKLVNSKSQVTFCKFHLISNQGPKNITPTEAYTLAATNPGYSTEDLYNAIATKNFPSWTLSIQLMTMEQAAGYRWNPFDSTKEWMPEDFPLIPVGTVVLNRNPQNHFAEVEQSAFDPGNLVPGIEMSPDPLLHGRSFSYPDTQRRRLGFNFEQFPINRPLVPVHSYFRDGPCTMTDNGGSGPNYFPNSFNGPRVSPAAKETSDKVKGIVDRWDTRDEDNYSQPRIFLAKLSPGEKQRLIQNLGFFLSYTVPHVQENMFKQLGNVSTAFELAVRTVVKAVDSSTLPGLYFGK